MCIYIYVHMYINAQICKHSNLIGIAVMPHDLLVYRQWGQLVYVCTSKFYTQVQIFVNCCKWSFRFPALDKALSVYNNLLNNW